MSLGMVSSVAKEQIMVTCQNNDGENIPANECIKRQREARYRADYRECLSCKQGEQIVRSMAQEILKTEYKQEVKSKSAQKELKSCITCGKKAEKLKKSECPSCASRRYREEQKGKKLQAMSKNQEPDNAVQENNVIIGYMDPVEQLSEKSIEIAPIGDVELVSIAHQESTAELDCPANDIYKLTLDFTEHPDILQKLKERAKLEFRQPDGQLMYWAWEMCCNGFGTKA